MLKKKVIITIIARLGSKRLPRKCLLPIFKNENSLDVIYKSALKVTSAKNIYVLTTKKRIDDEYPGSEIIKKQINSGVTRLRVGIKPDSKVIARAKTKIFNEENKEIGKITSGTFGPSVDHPISMGYVDNDYSSLDTKIFLEIRGKKVSANVCKLPFYQKNYVKEL